MTEFINYCRICMAEKKSADEDDFESIYKLKDGQSELTQLGQIYQELLTLLVFPDQTPQYFCNYCTLQLRLFHKFRNKALEVYKTFMKNVCKEECTSELEDNDDDMDIKLERAEPSEMHLYESFVNEPDEFEEVQYLEEYLSEGESDWKDIDMYDGSSDSINENNTERLETDDAENVTENRLTNNVNAAHKYRQVSRKNVNKINRMPKERVNKKSRIKVEDDFDGFDVGSHPCNYCDKLFNTKQALLGHKKKDHARTKYPCPICPKVLYSEETLQVHINVHNGLPAYQCDECEKTFKQKAHYVYHMMGHRNERNVQCHLCGKGFLNNSDLRIHLRVHNDERRYECDVCGKRFRAHTHMTNHRYSHFEKQLECEICLQKYSSPNTLRTHIKAVHKNECPYECETCHRRFKRKHHLKAHYKIHQKNRIISESIEFNCIKLS